MSIQGRRTLLIVIAVLFICLIGAILLLLIYNFAVPSDWMGTERPMSSNRWPGFLQRFDSNGERIYFTATSESGRPIIANVQGMHRMRADRMACADCHGNDGRGGVVRIMMSRFEAPDIRYHSLTDEGHGQEEDEHGGHPPYTDETIKRAITEGIDPAGEPLDWEMPRWEMDERDLDDLVEYLKTLD
jgi:cytochrome c oxidase subunit II